MKKLAFLFFFLQTLSLIASAQVTVQHLLCENLTNPIGLDVAQPRLSWQLGSDKRSIKQAAYEIRVSTDAGSLSKGKIWKSGRVSSDSSVYVAYAGVPLQSGKRYYWQVRVWDNPSGKPSSWSTPAFFQMALLTAADWKAMSCRTPYS